MRAGANRVASAVGLGEVKCGPATNGAHRLEWPVTVAFLVAAATGLLAGPPAAPDRRRARGRQVI